MFSKHILAGAMLASLAIAPANQAAADGGDIVGGIIGGIIGGAIVKGGNNNRTTTRRTTGSRVSSATRAENREIQTSLNYFGFPAGTPDGALGRKSRAAVSSYQAFMGYGVTGQLTTYEKDFLLASFHRAQAGGYATQELIDQNGQGTRGLLIAYREEQAGGNGQGYASGGALGGLPPAVASSVREIAKSSDPTATQLVQRAGFVQLSDLNADGRTDYILDTSVTGSAFWCSADSCAVRVFLSTPNGYQRNDFQAFNVVPAMFSCQGATCVKTDAPKTQTAALPTLTEEPSTGGAVMAAAPALPNFMGGAAEAKPSLASHCNQVSLVTSGNGGFVTQATMTDPAFALNEQFCLARTYAIAQGEDLASRLKGVTSAQLESQCAAFGPMLKPYVTALSLKPEPQVLQDVSSFVLTTGMTPEQLIGTSKICLSVGYRTDDLDVALGSALMLTALGEKPYGELLGHHLTQGYGTSARPDLALAWYQSSIDAINAGQPAVFAPGNPERTSLIQQAAFRMNGVESGNNTTQTQEQVQPVSAMPSFLLGDDSDG